MFKEKVILFLTLALLLRFRGLFSFTVDEVDTDKTVKTSVLIKNVQQLVLSLNKALDFINRYYYEINIDGVLGITLAEAQLRQAFKDINNKEIKAKLSLLIKKCQISKIIKQLLPEESYKHALFERFLLDPFVWENKNGFLAGQLEDMGMYYSWTAEDILKNRSATYNGITSDECIAEVLNQIVDDVSYHLCYVNPTCQTFMFDKRVDTAYVLTHRLLYFYILRIAGCMTYKKNIKYAIRHYCSLMLKEAKTNAILGFPQHDLFLEQVVLCGMEGFINFLQHDWTEAIMEWQTSEGCYKENKTHVHYANNVLKMRSANIISFGCTDHATGLGTAALAVNLRYVLWRLKL